MKNVSLRLTAILSVLVVAFTISSVTPIFDGSIVGVQQVQAAQKKPQVTVKKDSKGRKESYRKTTYHPNGKKKTERFITYNWNGTRKESDTTTKYSKAGKRTQQTKKSKLQIIKGGKEDLLLKSVVTKYSSRGVITSKKTTEKYDKYPYSLKRVTTDSYKSGKKTKSVVSKYANRPSFVPKNRATVKSNKKVTLEAGFLLDKNEYKFSKSGKKTRTKVWSPYHQKLVTPTVKKSVTKTMKRKKIVKEAERLLGNPYRQGTAGSTTGKGPYAFDCAGFVAYVYYKGLNIELPTAPEEQKKSGKFVANLKTEKDLKKLQVGDILYFEPTGGPHHTAIYVGTKNGIHQFIEATGTKNGRGGKKGVLLTNFPSMDSKFAPDQARRVI